MSILTFAHIFVTVMWLAGSYCLLFGSDSFDKCTVVSISLFVWCIFSSVFYCTGALLGGCVK